MVVETATLPSRLRECRPRRGYMNDIEATLNANGNQRVAECQCSVVDPEAWEPNGTPLTGAASDTRMPNADSSRGPPDQEDVHEVASHLDMDFLPAMTPPQPRDSSREHVFAQVDNLRGYLEEPDLLHNEDVGEARKRRRLANLPITEMLGSLRAQLHDPPTRSCCDFACINADRST